MRSPREIADRLKQESVNLRLWLAPPQWTPSETPPRSPLLPDPGVVAERLRGTTFAAEIDALAREIVAHRFPLLGRTIDTGPSIDWRRDYHHNRCTGLAYFRRIPYLDATKAGDHKNIWELNRHQHLVLLAQAHVLTGRREYADEIASQLTSWWEQNPFQRGINWASALEVAFRAVSWLWVLHLAGDSLPVATAQRLMQSLHQHGLHLETNLSIYFSPNTHLLGEAVALHALGVVFPGMPRAAAWAERGAAVVAQQLKRQVQADGSHFEQSTYYHVYALDMLLFHAILNPPDAAYRQTLARMADFLDTLMGPDRRLPFLGDDDGGRWFHPYGERAAFGRATLAACSAFLGRDDWVCAAEDFEVQACWWLNCKPVAHETRNPRSRFFPDAGIAVLCGDGGIHVVADAGPFGPRPAGHSHADTLSLVVTAGAEEVLVDPGTFTYVGDARLRDRFRGTAAHNTIRIDERDQADAAGPFRWVNLPAVRAVTWRTDQAEDLLEAECRNRGFTHRRQVRFIKPLVLLVVDEVDGPPGEHLVEQFWHMGSAAARRRCIFSRAVEREEQARSRCFSTQETIEAYCVRVRGAEWPVRLATAIVLRDGVDVAIVEAAGATSFHVTSAGSTVVYQFAGFAAP